MICQVGREIVVHCIDRRIDIFDWMKPKTRNCVVCGKDKICTASLLKRSDWENKETGRPPNNSVCPGCSDAILVQQHHERYGWMRD